MQPKPHKDEILTRNPPAQGDDGPLYVSSLAKAMRVLYAFGGNQSRLTARNIAQISGLDPSATQRFVYTLTVLGFLQKDERTKQYRLSARVLDFAYLYLRADPLCAIAHSHLHGLAQTTGEQVGLSILDRADVIYIDRLQGAEERDAPSLLGGRMPSFWTSNGRVLLAHIAKAEVETILESADLRPLTAKSLTDRGQIMAEVDLARKRGYAIVDEESELGILSIGAPVIDPSGRAVAAINLPLAKRKWAEQVALERFLPELLRTAQTIGRSLQGVEF